VNQQNDSPLEARAPAEIRPQIFNEALTLTLAVKTGHDFRVRHSHELKSPDHTCPTLVMIGWSGMTTAATLGGDCKSKS